MALTSSSVACVADSSAALSSSVRVPHTQSQCADTFDPVPGRAPGTAALPPLHPFRSRLRRAPAPRFRAAGARRDHRVLTLDRFHGSPADAAVLHDAERGRRIAVQKPDPRIDDEDVKAVVCQHLRGAGNRIEQPGDLSLERCPQSSQQARRVDFVPAGGRRPSSCRRRPRRADPSHRPPRRWPGTAMRRRTPWRARQVRRCRRRPSARSSRVRSAGRRTGRTALARVHCHVHPNSHHQLTQRDTAVVRWHARCVITSNPLACRPFQRQAEQQRVLEHAARQRDRLRCVAFLVGGEPTTRSATARWNRAPITPAGTPIAWSPTTAATHRSRVDQRRSCPSSRCRTGSRCATVDAAGQALQLDGRLRFVGHHLTDAGQCGHRVEQPAHAGCRHAARPVSSW